MNARPARLLVLTAAICAVSVAGFSGVAFAADPAPDPNATPLQDIVALISSHGWLPLFAFALLYARKLCGPDSKFPINVPPTWLPTVSAFFGLLYGGVSSYEKGTPLGTAALTCVVLAGSSGFFDGLLTAIFNHGAAPKWAQALVALVDDLTGGGTNATKSGQAVKATGPAAPVSSTAAKVTGIVGALLLVFGLGGTATSTTACKGGSILPVSENVVAVVLADLERGDSYAQIASDVCKALGGNAPTDAVCAGAETLVQDVIQYLIDTGTISPPAVARGREYLAAHPKVAK